MSFQELIREREVWKRKPELQAIYSADFFPRLNQYRKKSAYTLEVGGGPGFYKEFFPEIISSDIITCPWHDMALNATRLPFKSESFDNIVGMDVVHHLDDPLLFLREAERILRPQGRIVLIEPWMTPFSYFINRFCMPEDCDLRWRMGNDSSQNKVKKQKEPFEANSAIPFLLFHRYRDDLFKSLPKLTVVKIELFSLFRYLLSMGFREKSLLPYSLYSVVSKVETATQIFWRRVAALKALIVLERI